MLNMDMGDEQDGTVQELVIGQNYRRFSLYTGKMMPALKTI